jgi:hypothetical protein
MILLALIPILAIALFFLRQASRKVSNLIDDGSDIMPFYRHE